jgi:hypothetical protein
MRICGLAHVRPMKIAFEFPTCQRRRGEGEAPRPNPRTVLSIALEEGEDLRGPLGRLFEGRPVAAVVEEHEARVGDVVEDRDRCRPALFSLRAMRRWPANCSRWPTTIEKVRFASDSPLEEAGFELLVPPARKAALDRVRRPSVTRRQA